jgi:hypothetical protein
VQTLSFAMTDSNPDLPGPKANRESYEIRMRSAISFYNTCPSTKISAIACQFGVNRKTLSNHIKEPKIEIGRGKAGGHNRILSPAQNEAIYKYIERQYWAGFPATRGMVHAAVGHLISLELPPKPMPSGTWIHKYLKEQSNQVKKLKTKTLDNKRQTA